MIKFYFDITHVSFTHLSGKYLAVDSDNPQKRPSATWYDTYLADDANLTTSGGEQRDKSKWDLTNIRNQTFYVISTEVTHLDVLPPTGE